MWVENRRRKNPTKSLSKFHFSDEALERNVTRVRVHIIKLLYFLDPFLQDSTPNRMSWNGVLVPSRH